MSTSVPHKYYGFLRILIQAKSKKFLYALIIISLWLFVVPVLSSATCSGSTSSSYTMTSLQSSFSGYTSEHIYEVVQGLVSNSFYFMSYLSPPGHTAVRKVNPDKSLAWIASVSNVCMKRTFTVDNVESYLYFALASSSLIVIRLLSSTGSISDQREL